MKLSLLKIILFTLCIWYNVPINAQIKNTKNNSENIYVIAYYRGSVKELKTYPLQYLTHIIYSFGGLKGNRLNFWSAADTLLIHEMVALKKKHPKLKVILSLGGWSGCYTCSAVFNNPDARLEFANSVQQAITYFKADGIDLDWEYPAIPGEIGHPYMAADKENFTALIQIMRKQLGAKSEISFASGGFPAFIDSSIEWKKVMPLVNRVNVMTYDLVHGYSTISGHHTPLYPTGQQTLSVDAAITYMKTKGVPKNKMVIGGAFYARFFETTDTINNGLYRPCKFKYGISYKNLADTLQNGYTQYWDNVAKAPYAFNAERKLFVSFDDQRSIALKTKYVRQKKLNGIMFWQLTDDFTQYGLLEAIYKALK